MRELDPEANKPQPKLERRPMEETDRLAWNVRALLERLRGRLVDLPEFSFRARSRAAGMAANGSGERTMVRDHVVSAEPGDRDALGVDCR